MAEPQVKAKAKCKSISPHFVVPDVVASAEYYRDVLGFKILSYFLDPPVFAVVARDDVVIHFGKSDNGALPSPNATRRSIGVDAYIWVNDLDALYAELQGRGARILEPPAMRVYKCYELLVEDNCGFRLCFSMDTSSVPS
jgi:catechol 2,3-dioxygenase-like lactoylglutathione lyase family enzyme